jgi:hypothetical protein
MTQNDATRDSKGVDMEIKATIKSQYYASLEMLRQAIVECPESLWHDPEYKNPFWHIAYHVLFYTHLYLQPSKEDFVPWEKHREECVSLGSSGEGPEAGEPYSKEEILAYHGLCCEQVEERVTLLDLEAESGFYWLPFDKLELQIYNIRHIQQHTGELYERLGAIRDIEAGWVGMKPD